MNSKQVKQNYSFLVLMVIGMVTGAIVGYFFPDFGHGIAPVGTVFINLMFCVVVPLVFASVASSISNMKSRGRAGKIMVSTLVVFVVTGIIAGVVMFLVTKIFPPVLEPWQNMATEEVGEHADLATMIVNFFTTNDFVGLLSRKAMLPLIVFSILFGFATQMCGGDECPVGQWLNSLTQVMMKFISIIMKIAPIAFFAIFADLLATYGSAVTVSYGRAMLIFYPLSFIYIFTMWPLFAYIGGGKNGPKVMFQHILRPVITSLGTCSSVATIPTNVNEAYDTGISHDIADLVCPLGATMLVVVFSAVGCSGVPGGGYIGEYIVASLFFPQQIEVAFPILVAIGNLVDPPGTMINSAGDYVVCFLVSRFVEGKDWLEKVLANKTAA